MLGYKETDDLDAIFDINNLDAAPVYERRWFSNNQNASVSTDSAFATGSQTSIGIDDQQNGFHNTEIFDTNSTFSVRDNRNISTDSVFGRGLNEASSISSTRLTDLSFFSLMERSSMEEFLQRPTIITQENSVFLPTQDEQSFTQIFDNLNNSTPNSTSSRIYSEDAFLGPANSSLLTPNITAFFGNNSTADSTSYHEFEDQNDTQRPNLDSQITYSEFDSQNSLYKRFVPPAVPPSIQNLYDNVKSKGFSDWTFVHLLSAQLCQDFMPMNCNVTLKKSLLLSIASINSETNEIPIPIIAVEDYSSSANSIMLNIGNYAQRFLAPTDHLFNVSINSDMLVEIGPIFMAKNGVCYLGNWSGLKKSFAEEVKIIIDTGRYFHNETTKNFKLGSAIWTYWSSTQKIKTDNVNIPIFLTYFGIPIILDSDEGNTVDFLLNEAKNGGIDNPPKNIFNISYDDIKTFLNIIRKIKVTRSVDAQRLLEFYSETIKKDREDVLSFKGVQVIQQMANSFAKLCRRNEVGVCDVEAAIAIAEETFNKILKPRTTTFPQAPILGCTYDVKKIDQYLHSFHQWIYYYIAFGNNRAE